MPHNLHRADCPCLRCERPRHPSEVRMGLRGIVSALPLSATLWGLIALAAHLLHAR